MSKKECGVFRLIRTSCKVYHQRGSDECGVAHYFNSFLDNRHEKPYLRSLLLEIDLTLFSVMQHLCIFIRKKFFHAWPKKNNLLEAANEDISNKLYLAEVRALGIADKVDKGLFWRIVENVDNMLEINPYLIQLKVSLSSLSVDAKPMFRGVDVFCHSGYDNSYEAKCQH